MSSSHTRFMPHERWLRIIPVAFIMYTIAFVERINISLALPSISQDLHMDPAQAGDAAGVFFWGYLMLQIPGGHLARRWSAKRFVAILLVLWGICAIASGFVQTHREFWAMRLLLGVAEGGVFPATLVLLSNWFPRAERASANALWMLCLPVAVIISSPVSGWILSRWNWRFLLVAEGVLPFVWLLVWSAFIDDHPHQAKWISAEEREYLGFTLLRESVDIESVAPKSYLRALFCPAVLVMAFLYFLLNGGGYGYLFWLPSALESANKKMSGLVVAVLFTIPYVFTGFGMVLNSRHSDQSRERRVHVAIPLGVGGASLLAGVLVSGWSPLLSFVFLCLAGSGPFAALGPFWAIPTETLPRGVSGSAMGLVNAIGNLGGYFGPLMVGYLNRRTGNFIYAFGLLSLALILSSALAFLLPSTRAAEHIQTTVGAN